MPTYPKFPMVEVIMLARAGGLADAALLWLLRRRQGIANHGDEPREEVQDDRDARE